MNAGLDPNNLPDADKTAMNFGSAAIPMLKPGMDIWGSGQGIGSIQDAPPASELISRLREEYLAAIKKFG